MDPVALLLADARLPTGTYAHSLGLEQAVRDGLDAVGVPRFLAARLELVARADAELSVAAARAARTGDVDALDMLDDEHAARTPSPPLRQTATRLGRQLLRTAATLWPDRPVLTTYRARSATSPRPIAFGVVAAVAGLADEPLATVALYDDAASVSAAALKLLAIDPAQASRWIVAELPRVRRLAAEAAAAVWLPERAGPAAPALDRAAMAHAGSERRLFAS
jgi:urease accessory protein